jgi:histidinol phosphatase-like PHP family hydrolase
MYKRIPLNKYASMISIVEFRIIFSVCFIIIHMFPDHHLHSRYSRCSPGTHTLFEIYEKCVSQKKSYACISDHIHYDNDDQYFVHHLQARAELQKRNFSIPLYLGAEITILDTTGHIAKQEKSLGYLDYFMVGDHYIPETPITMEQLSQSRNILREWMEINSENLTKMFKIIKDMYCGAIEKYKPMCLVHPFSTLLRCDFAHIELYDVFEKVCETCQKCGVAIELNESQIQSCYEAPTPQCLEHPDIPSKADFYSYLIKISKKYDLKYSTGSDGHLLKDIGIIPGIERFVEQNHIETYKIVNLREKIGN